MMGGDISLVHVSLGSITSANFLLCSKIDVEIVSFQSL